MNQHPDCTPNDLLHMIDAPTPRRPEDMTIEEMAEALGLSRDCEGDWSDAGCSPMVCNWGGIGVWTSWPYRETRDRQDHATEREAMERLYHLALKEGRVLRPISARAVQPTTPLTPAPIVEPAPAQRGGNVALVMRALEAWKRVPKIAADVDDATARAFGAMLAEAYVADAKEGA